MKDNYKEYNNKAVSELKKWQSKTSKAPSPYSKLTKSVQKKINRVIPEKFHEIVTGAIKTMVKAVLFGSKYITAKPLKDKPLMEREELIKKRFTYYKFCSSFRCWHGSGWVFIKFSRFPNFARY